MRRRVDAAPMDSAMLSLILDEYFDLQAAIDELEARREKLRAGILRECARERGFDHPRGRVRISRYESFDADRTGPLIPILEREGWVEDVLSVRGRQLYKLAFANA